MAGSIRSLLILINQKRNKKKSTFIPPKPDLHDLLVLRSLEDTASFVEKHLFNAIYRPSRETFIRSVLNQLSFENLVICEFGVYKARSTNYLAKLLPHSTIHGFDSFLGLPHKWSGNDLDKGYFDLNGQLPIVENNVKLWEGDFSDTIPKFKSLNPTIKKIDLLIIDCDIYESTKIVLNELNSLIKTDTIIIFDEYFGYPNWRNHEYKAFIEFSQDYRRSYEYLFYRTRQVCLRIK